MLVGIIGYAQHGKDTVASVLVEEAGFTRIGFADALKDLALRVNPIIRQYNFPKHGTRLATAVGVLGWEAAKQDPEVRRFLQNLGTEARNVLGEDVWVRALDKRWLDSELPNLVVPDVRFPNEHAWVRRNNGVIVRVTRPNFDNGVGTDHASEQHVEKMFSDICLVNSGSIGDLQLQARQLVEKLVTAP